MVPANFPKAIAQAPPFPTDITPDLVTTWSKTTSTTQTTTTHEETVTVTQSPSPSPKKTAKPTSSFSARPASTGAPVNRAAQPQPERPTGTRSTNWPPPVRNLPPYPLPMCIKRPLSDPEGYYVIIVGEEVGLFYAWSDVLARTSFTSPRPEYRVFATFRLALAYYARKHDFNELKAVPQPGSRFYPVNPPTPSPTPPSSPARTAVDVDWEEQMSTISSQLEDVQFARYVIALNHPNYDSMPDYLHTPNSSTSI